MRTALPSCTGQSECYEQNQVSVVRVFAISKSSPHILQLYLDPFSIDTFRNVSWFGKKVLKRSIGFRDPLFEIVIECAAKVIRCDLLNVDLRVHEAILIRKSQWLGAKITNDVSWLRR